MTAVRFCPSCGAARLPEARFCSNCGADLAALGQQETPAQSPIPATAALTPPATPQPLTPMLRPKVGVAPVGPTLPTARRFGVHPLAIFGLVLALLVLAGGGVWLISRPPAGSTGGVFVASPLVSPAGGYVQVVDVLLPLGDRQPDATALSTTKSILENRLRAIGVADATVEVLGTDRIVVTLPSGSDVESIRALLVQTGKLDVTPLPPAEYGTGSVPGTYQAVEGQPLPTSETPLFGGDQIDQAYPSADATGLRAVGFRLKSQGSAFFADYTSKHVGEFVAIVLDDKVVSAPLIQSAITGGQGIITGGSGGFSAAQMNSLITVLNSGSLPFPVKEISVQSTPTPDPANAAP